MIRRAQNVHKHETIVRHAVQIDFSFMERVQVRIFFPQFLMHNHLLLEHSQNLWFRPWKIAYWKHDDNDDVDDDDGAFVVQW